MSEKKYVLAIGELLIDAISDEFIQDLSEARSLDVFPGGSPANFCRFLSACGADTRLVAAVGRDGFGKILLNSLEKSGISTRYVQQLSDHFTTLIAVARTQGTPDFLPYRDADKFLQPVPDQLIEGALLVHTTAFALSFDPARTVILQAFAKAHQKGIIVTADWNYAEKIWGKPNQADQVFESLQSFRPLLKFSMDDVERSSGVKMSVSDARSFLRNLNAAALCLTCGSEGVWFKCPDHEWQHQAAPPVEVKDATGAGDAFWAGFIAGYIVKKPLSDCVSGGVETAAKRLRGEL